MTNRAFPAVVAAAEVVAAVTIVASVVAPAVSSAA
jgi:hypothetical protein